MRSARSVGWLLLLLLVPCAGLAVVGILSLAGEKETVRRRMKDQADAALDAAWRAVLAEAEGTSRGEGGALMFKASGDGRLIEPTGAAALPPARVGDREVELTFRFTLSRADDLEARGDGVAAARLLRDYLQTAPPDAFTAAGFTALGAIERKLGNRDAAAEALRTLVERFPRECDDRGLPRSFAARWILIEIDAAPLTDGTLLLRDVMLAHASADEYGIAAFKERLTRALEEAGPA